MMTPGWVESKEVQHDIDILIPHTESICVRKTQRVREATDSDDDEENEERMPVSTMSGSGYNSAAPPKPAKCCTWPIFIGSFAILALGAFLIWYFVPFGAVVQLPGFNNTDADVAAVPLDPRAPTASPTPAPTKYRFDQCTKEEGCCNGIDGLCDSPANEVMYAFSHNSHASFDEGFSFSANHNLNLEQSLDGGIRGITLDWCICDDRIVLCHGICVGFRDPLEVFQNIKAFMDSNPREVLVISMQMDDVSVNDAYGFLQTSNLTSIMYDHPSALTSWPTLQTLKDMDKRIIMFFYNSPSDCSNRVDGCPSGMNYYFADVVENNFDFNSIAELETYDQSCALDRGVGGTRNFFILNSFITPLGLTASPLTVADINEGSSLERLIDECSARNPDLDINGVMVDYWHLGDLIAVVQSRNADRVVRRQLIENRSNLRR